MYVPIKNKLLIYFRGANLQRFLRAHSDENFWFVKMKETIVDPLGFTKQTEMLLHGIGATELIKEFKIRNISSDALHKLTKEDFMLLGASEDHAKRMIDTLNISKRKNSNAKPKPHHRISDHLEILKLGENQLSLIQAYLAYCKFRLRQERINFFVEPDKAISASNILCVAANDTLTEVNETGLRLKELEAMIIKPKNRSRYLYVLYYASMGGVCIATYKFLINRLWK